MRLSDGLAEAQRIEVAHNVEKAWRITDVAALNRADWRRLSLGERRVSTQKKLLALAESEKPTTQADRLAMYQAAYAILPLHGDSLNALARLLIESGFVELEWADVLIESLAQTPPGTPHAEATLSALRKTLSSVVTLLVHGPTYSAQRRRAYTFASQMADLGYRTAWGENLLAALAPTRVKA